MTQTTSNFQMEVKDQVLFLLSNKLLTIKDIADSTGYSYPSVSRAMRELVSEGRALKFDKRARNARYTIGNDPTAAKTVIPSISFKNKIISLTEIYLGRGIEQLADTSAETILRAWCNIATVARRLDEGLPEEVIVRKLSRDRVALAEACTNLENLAFMCRQLIDNKDLWDAEKLAKFPEDENWRDFLPHLNDLYSHFYEEGRQVERTED